MRKRTRDPGQQWVVWVRRGLVWRQVGMPRSEYEARRLAVNLAPAADDILVLRAGEMPRLRSRR
jgi:hypothetical protein